MALFQSYAKPGVYTSVQIESAGESLFGSARIPVLIGEGLEYFTTSNFELIRGSSAVADNQVIGEDLSDQVTGLNNTFQVTYFPVTDGSGKGVVTNDPSKVQVVSEGIPLTVVQLNGATGQFVTQEIIPLGDNLTVTYFFKRTDTLVKNEDLSAQVPTFATLVYGASTFSLTVPGDLGNTITLAFTLTVGSGKSDALAVSGAGTSTISIELLKAASYAVTQVQAATPDATHATYLGSFPVVPAAGTWVWIDGFSVNPSNNGAFQVGTGSTSSALVVLSTVAVNETHVATASPIRTLDDIQSLVTAGIPTTYGYLTDTGGGNVPGTVLSATPLAGGTGPQTNTVFKTHFTPIVDGTNGGVTTTNPALVTVLVNGLPVIVSALDGQHGLVTLANGVAAGSTLTITYYYNTYQYTFDILPAAQVASIVQVGLGPNRSDFTQGVDFELSQDGTLIEWGANADVAVGLSNVNSTAVFGPIDITTTLIDEQVWLRPVTGSVNGVNAVFTLQDVPVDGSGLNRPTDNPALIAVYVGPDPVTALLAGKVSVSQLNGRAASLTLFNPPASGNVYASYWRSQLNDHVFTLTVQNPGIPGQGTYSITDEIGRVVPSTVVGPATVFQSGPFANLGIVWPNNFPDLSAEAGDKTETVTVTFQDDDLVKIITPAVQATHNAAFGGTNLRFTATEIGAVEQDFTAPNGVTDVTFVNNAGEGIASVGSLGSSPVYSGGTATPGPTLGHFFTGGTPLAYSAVNAQWKASQAYVVGDAIYDSVSQTIQVVTTAGTSGAVKPGTVYNLTSADNAVGPNTTYHGLSGFLNGTNPDGLQVTIAGFIANPGNNGTFTVVSHTLTDLVLNNSGGVSETQASTATVETAFSVTPGTPTSDGTSTLAWTSNGTITTSPEDIYINIITEAAATRTVANAVTLFSGSNLVNTPKAGKITAALTAGSGSTSLTAQGPDTLNGGVNPVSVDYAQRFLVTSSITGGAGSGQATTPASANVDASGPWAANTIFQGGQIIHFTVSGNDYLAQANVYGSTSGSNPFSAPSTITGATTSDGEITWTTLGPVVTPVGANGYLGQTYVDTVTGVKFTIVDPAEALNYGYTNLPSPQYNFMPGDTLTFSISANETTAGPTYQPFVTGTTPIINIGGLKVKVTTTFGSTAGDTALINTFKGDANEPNVGEFYYITFTVNKTADDMALKLYTNTADVYRAYGQPNTVNRVSLAAQLLAGNGAQQFGIVQVPKQPNLNVGSDASYEAAIQSLSKALPGTQNKVNVIVPLSTSNAVQQYLGRFLTTQAAPRQKGEAIGFVGMGLFNTPQDASALANALHNARVILVAPFAFGIQITNPTTGVAIEYAVSGEFAAAAMAGLSCNPANDVATSLTNQNIVGFSRILIRLDDPTMDLMASNGVTLLIEQSGGLQVRHYKSTDPSNIITSEPTCTTITDFVCQAFRSDLKQFIGRKLIGSILGSIQIVCNGRLKSLVDAQIIQGYSAPQVRQDQLDPTTVDITVTFQPVFTLLYIGVTFTVTSSSVSSAGSATGAGQTGTGTGA